MAQKGGQRRLPNELLAELSVWVSVLELFTASQLDKLVTSSALLYAYVPDVNEKLELAFRDATNLFGAEQQLTTSLCIYSFAIIERIKEWRKLADGNWNIFEIHAVNMFFSWSQLRRSRCKSMLWISVSALENPCLYWLLRRISARTGQPYDIRVSQQEFFSAKCCKQFLAQSNTLVIDCWHWDPKQQLDESSCWEALADWLMESPEKVCHPKKLARSCGCNRRNDVLEPFIHQLSQRFSTATQPSSTFTFHFYIGRQMDEFELFNPRTDEVLQLRVEKDPQLRMSCQDPPKWPTYVLLRRPAGEKEGNKFQDAKESICLYVWSK